MRLRGEPRKGWGGARCCSIRRGELNELALGPGIKLERFRVALLTELVVTLADLVRSMNCYYSNFIESHRTHPIDIERAFADDYSPNPETGEREEVVPGSGQPNKFL